MALRNTYRGCIPAMTRATELLFADFIFKPSLMISREKSLRALLDNGRLDKTQGHRQRYTSIQKYKTERPLLNNAHYILIYHLHISCFVPVISHIFAGSYNRLNLVMNGISFSSKPVSIL
jgi:hypothetical protein